MFYVDDGLVAARTAEEADGLVKLVGSMFAIRELGEPTDFLGIQIERDEKAGTVSIHQTDKAVALAKALKVDGVKKLTPLTPEVFSSLRAAQPGEQMTDKVAYQAVVGSLLHLVQCTRPDLALAVGALAAYCSAPSAAHHAALLDVVRYVGHTASWGITYGSRPAPLEVWCDANFAACLETRRSTTGWTVIMYGGAVSWSSKKQATAAASTMETEYQACGAVASEALSLRKIMRDLQSVSRDFPLSGPISVACDNKAALVLCKNCKEGQRSKHIDVIHHFARDHVMTGELDFVYCKSESNISGCLTKALTRPLFEKGLCGLGMISA
jgi:hypothetical protein